MSLAESASPPASPRMIPSMWLPLALGALAYLNTIGFGFVWDDKHLIVDNTLVRQASPLPALVSDFWQEGERTDFYRPLVSLSYFLEFRLWKLSPAGYHAANVADHLAATLAVTATARLLFGSSLAAIIAGIVFALHPIHTESVAFISGRPDVLACTLLVGAFALFVRSRRLARGVSAGSLVLFVAALLCKETALALPAVLVAYELAPIEPGGPTGSPSRGALVRRLAALTWPYLAAAAAYLGLRWVVLGAPVGTALDRTPPGTRALIAVNAFGEYLRLLLVPYPAAPDRLPDQSLSGGTIAAIVVLALLAIALVWRRRHYGIPAFLAAWFVLTLLPASPLVLGRAPQVAERFLYIPSVAWAWLLGWAGAGLWAATWFRPPALRAVTAVLAVGLVVCGAGLTALRNLDWRDDYHLFTRMATSEPRSYLAPLNLGHLYVHAGYTAEAEAEFRRALEIRPNSSAALLGLALVASRMGTHDLAIRYGERARDLAPQGDLIYAQLGSIYGIAGRYPEAVASFRESIRRNPRRLHARANLVMALTDAGRLSEAADALGEAERLLAAESYQDPVDVRMLAQVRQRLALTRESP